jgi:single-strand DNA-binding protein
MVNKVILVGQLGRDPETKYTQSGQAVCNFTIATDESYKNRSGDKVDKVEWHRIVIWGKLAEVAQQYLKKGQLVYLEGKIQTRNYDDRNGAKKQTTEIVVFTMKMLGGGQNHAAEPEQETDPGAEDTGTEEETSGF